MSKEFMQEIANILSIIFIAAIIIPVIIYMIENYYKNKE